MSELKPCPFCGGEPTIYKKSTYFRIYCTSCTANLGLICNEKESIILSWNTRAEDAITAKLKALEGKGYKWWASWQRGIGWMYYITIGDGNLIMPPYDEYYTTKAEAEQFCVSHLLKLEDK